MRPDNQKHRGIFHQISVCALLVISFACSKTLKDPAPVNEPIVEEVSYPDVDENLWIYFERFEKEAKTRGVTIDLAAEEISAVIEEIDEDRVAGQCNYNRLRPNHITIDESYWRKTGERYREFVVFHELGHCALFRAHREEATTQNVCLSIMRSGTGICFDNYNTRTRQEYLDELFDPSFEGDLFFTVHE